MIKALVRGELFGFFSAKVASTNSCNLTESISGGNRSTLVNSFDVTDGETGIPSTEERNSASDAPTSKVQPSPGEKWLFW